MSPSAQQAAAEQPSLLTESDEELLDTQGASTETLRWWRTLEDQALKRSSEGEGLELGTKERLAVFNFVSNCATMMTMEHQQCIQAMACLDAFLVNAPAEVGVGFTPLATLAVMTLLKKADKPAEGNVHPSWYPGLATLTRELHTLGHDVEDCSGESLVAAERVLLKALQWRVELPSVASWFEKYFVRFRLLTRQKAAAVEVAVWRFGFAGATQLVRLTQASGRMPPRVAAAGLLALGLARSGVLPPDSLRPQGTSPDAWHMALCSARLVQSTAALAGGGSGAVPAAVSPEVAQQMLEMLLLPAVDVGIEKLRQACLQVTCILAQPHRQCERCPALKGGVLEERL